MKADEIVKRLNLKPHAEGGYYLRTYQSDGYIPHGQLPECFQGDRPYATAILYLLPEGFTSRLHRIASDEIWNFHLGGPMTLVQISPKGLVEEIVMGSKLEEGHCLQHVVPAGYWFGAYPNPESPFCLMGCTVTPGFDWDDFEMANRDEMLEKFPNAEEIIRRLTVR